VVHGTRNQPSKRSGIVVEIDLPDILAQSQNAFLIFQRTHHRFGRSTEIRLERKPSGMVPFRFGLFRHVDHNDGTVHGTSLMDFVLERGSCFASSSLGRWRRRPDGYSTKRRTLEDMRLGERWRCTQHLNRIPIYHAVNEAHHDAVGEHHSKGEQRWPNAEAEMHCKRAKPQQRKENQVHRQPSEYSGDEPLNWAAVARQMMIKIGEGKAPPRSSR
jgi:hypothetical protein